MYTNSSNYQYLNLYISNRDLVAELPFVLMHPKPSEDPPPLPVQNAISAKSVENEENAGINTDLIRLDTYVLQSLITLQNCVK